MGKIRKNNNVTVIGKIADRFTFSHEVYGEGFYMTYLKVKRLSGKIDMVPIMISEQLVDADQDYIGRDVAIQGEFHSYNHNDGTKRKLILFVHAQEITFIKSSFNNRKENNQIYLNGYICKKPEHRKTPLGREITDLLIAVNRPDGRSDYIPCIAWGRNARYAAGFSVGSNVELRGRVQSREYSKQVGGHSEQRTAYECSIHWLGR